MVITRAKVVGKITSAFVKIETVSICCRVINLAMHLNRSHSACSVLILLFIITIHSNAFSQTSPIKRMGSLNTVSFDDAWLFARFGLQPDGTRKEEPAGLESGNFNDATWQKLSLPHDWAITGPFRIELDGGTGKLPWKGIGWYRKHFTIPAADATKKIFIDFDGAMANAKIWLNGKYVGTWPYGYTSFRMDLTPYIQPGKENVLAVRLYTEQWDSRWYPGAGIYRHVWLVKTDPVHVDHWGTYITTPRITEASAEVNIAVTVRNHSKKAARATVRTELYELDAANKPTVKVAEMKECCQRPGIVLAQHMALPLQGGS